MVRNLIFVIILVISIFKIGSLFLFDVDEAVFSEATKEMVQTGNWITPTYNDTPRYDKPILFYWLMAVSYKLFGISEFSSRLPSALSGFILCIGIFYFLRSLNKNKEALYAVVSFAFSLYYLIYTHAAVTDMTLTMFISLSLFSFYLAVNKDKRFIYGFYIFSALAFLTKGLIGVVFPFAVAGIYIILRDGISGVKSICNVKAFLVFLVVSLPWYICQIVINGQDFIQQFFIKHHFMRYTGVISGHRGPIYYFIPVLIVGLFPWIAFLPAGFKNLKKDSLKLFALIWFGFIFLFFSLSTTKLPNYILPAVPALSILVACAMIEHKQRWSSIPPVISGIISMLFGVIFLFLVNKVHIYLPDFDVRWIYLVVFIMFAFTVISFYSILKRKTPYVIIASLSFIFLMVVYIGIMPAVNESLQGTLYRYSLYIKQLPDSIKIISYKVNKPSIVFYSGKRVSPIYSEKDCLPILQTKDSFIVITKKNEIKSLKNIGLTLIMEDKHYAIFEKK